MTTLRMIALVAFISHINVRPIARLMATAFAPPRCARSASTTTTAGFGIVDSIISRHAILPREQSLFVPLQSSSSSSSSNTLILTTTKLYSTTAPENDVDVDDVVTYNNDDIQIDPYSEQAKEDLANFYEQNGIETDDIGKVHDSLLVLTEQVLQWNGKLNLISRKDCNAAVVYHRHILPSIALLPLILERQQQSDEDGESKLNIVDVGTGGGFPGLPLALLLPNAQFTMVDSVQKKLKAVGEMAAELDMLNVRIHWGRVEEMYADEKGKREHKGRYDVVLGRSVTALPRFCGWVADLLKKGDKEEEEEGRLIYIIGGDLDNLVESRIVHDIPLDKMLQRAEGTSDKRALTFSAKDVEEIGTESGEKDKIVRSGPGKKNRNGEKRGGSGKKKAPKGAWSQKRNDVKKDRGYDNFQRYES